MPALTVQVNGDTKGIEGALNSLGGSLADKLGLGGTKVGAALNVAGSIAKKTQEIADHGRDAIASQELYNQKLNDAKAAAAEMGVDVSEWDAKLNDAIATSRTLGGTADDAKESFIKLFGTTTDIDAMISQFQKAQDIASEIALTTGKDAIDVSAIIDEVSRMYTQIAETGKATAPLIISNALGPKEDWAAYAQTLNGEVSRVWSESGAGRAAIAAETFKTIGEAISTTIAPIIDGIKETLISIGVGIANFAGGVRGVLQPAVDAFIWVRDTIQSVLDKVSEVLDKLKFWDDEVKATDEALNNLNVPEDVKGIFGRGKSLIDLPGGFGNKSGTPSGPGVNPMGRNGASGNLPASTVMNIYGSPATIEAKVTKVLRDYTRRNGPGAVFTPGRS